MLLGMTLGVAVVLRLAWALIGTRHARFASLVFPPGAVVRYLRGVLTNTGQQHPGHNPASAYAIIAMVALLMAVVATGMAMSFGIEAGEELHSVAAWALVAVAVIHVLGVIIHTLRFKENITLGMITGRKVAEKDQAISSARPVAGLVFLLLVGAFAALLLAGWDRAAKQTSLPLVGATIRLSGEEHGDRHRPGERRPDREEDHDD
jgi:cytochrome b